MFDLSDLDSLTLDIPTLESSIYQNSFSTFCQRAWEYVEPSNPLLWNWHLEEYCNVLEKVYHGEIKRLIVNVPPGTSKSTFFSVLFNAWVWCQDPAKRFLTASYSIDLTLRDNKTLSGLLKSEWYRNSFDLQLSSDAKEKLETTKKGWRIATSVGGLGTGEHPHFLIIDDPIKAKEANSEAVIKEANNWISNTVSTRKALDPSIILVMQRLIEDDPSGFLLSKGGWDHLCFPMRFESKKVDENDPRNIPDPRDRRKVEGELLHPQMWSEEKVNEEELLLGISASGQLQQRPIPLGGALFERSWFEFVDQSPIEAYRCRGWDIAETDAKDVNAKKNNWTVGTRISKDKKTGIFYVEHNVRAQLTIVDDLIKSTAIMDGKKCKIREGRGSGKATIKARATLLAGYDYDFSPETDSKIQRANPFRAQSKAGNVKIVKGDWNEIWLNVICSFPFGSCDDDVDSSSNAFNELAGTVRKKGKLTW